MKKALRILARVGMVLLCLLLALWLFLQMPFFQQWLTDMAAHRLSKVLGTRVVVGKARILLLNRVNIEDVYVADQQQDTLVSIGMLQVNTSDWFLLKDSVDLKYIRLEDVRVRLYRKDTTWNYQFIADQFAGDADTAKGKKIGVGLHDVELENLSFIQMDAWKGRTQLLGIGQLHLHARQLHLGKGFIDIQAIEVDAPEFREFRVKGLWSAQDSINYYRRIDSLDKLPKPPRQPREAGLQLAIDEIKLRDGVVELYNRKRRTSTAGQFDERDIIIQPIQGLIRNLRLVEDTLSATAQLSARERSGLNIKNLFTRLTIHPQMMEFDQLDLQLNDSRLGPYYAMRYSTLDNMEYFLDSVRITARMRNSRINLQDIGFFAPELKTIKQVVTLSGNAEGTVSDFVVTGVDLATGRSRLRGRYSMKGLTDIERTVINFQTPGSDIALEDVAVWAPEILELRKTPVANLGVINFQGNYSGTVFDFVANGRLGTAVGSMNANLKMKLEGRGKGFSAAITNADLDGGRLLDVSKLGRIKFDGNVSSAGLDSRSPILLKGLLSSGVYNNYNYQDIRLDGTLTESKLEVELSANDPNLMANFSAVLNFREKQQRHNTRGNIGYANLHSLGFTKDTVTVSGLFDVDFQGANIDEFLGYARFYDAQVIRNSRELNVDSFYLAKSMDTLGLTSLIMRTNEADLDIKGIFNVRDLPIGFRHLLNRYYPSVIDPPASVPKNQQFTFSLTTREAEPLLSLVDERIKGLNYATMLGSLDLNSNEMYLSADVPHFEFEGVSLTNVVVNTKGSADNLSLTTTVDNISVNDSLNFPKAVLTINTRADTTDISLISSSQGPLGDAILGGVFYSKSDGFDLHFNESSFILNNKKWMLRKNGSVQMRNGYLMLDQVFLQCDDQELSMYTHPSEEGNWNDLYLKLRRLNMGDLLPFFLTDPSLEGMISGDVLVSNPLGKPDIRFDLKAEDFYFNKDSVGMVKLEGHIETATMQVEAHVDSRNPQYDFSSQVKLNLKDSVANQIETTVQLRNERISLLENYLSGIIAKMEGLASGELRIVGKLSAPSILGKVFLRQAEMKVDYTQCTYFIDTATLVFGDNFINFGTINLKDGKGRKGYLEGIMYHRFFDSLYFNLKMRTDGMEVLNTRSADNDLFYGNVVGKASFDLTGPLSNLNMKISGAPVDSSHVYISNKTGKESGEADFIVFKTYGREMEAVVASDETNIHMDLDIIANPLVQIDVILDEITNDVIRATGSGNFKIRAGTRDETVMRGRYQVERGSYNYNFQSVLKKPFVLEGGDDSWIEWQGDPLNANMNIKALYVAKNVSLRELMASEQGSTVLDQEAQNYKGDVYVRARLSGRLYSPKITFSIDFPPGSAMRNNLSATDMMRRITEDESETLRQVTYLIVFQSFAPYKQGSGNVSPSAELAVSTISDILSREMGKILTNLVQGITGDRSIDVDFSTDFYNSQSISNGQVSSTSTGYDRVNFNFMLKKSYFNNRVVVNLGSDFDMNVRNTTSTGVQFLPDVSVEFILTQNRRLRAILFKRDNLDYAGRRNTAGASLSYRKEFDHIVGRNREESFLYIGRKDEVKPAPVN